MGIDPDLLRPSLARSDAAGAALYSPRTGFLSAFFGGPVAALVFGGVNSHRLGRLGRDLPVYAAGLVLLLISGWWIEHGPHHEQLSQWLGQRAASVVFRALGLGFFGVAYLLHRQAYRSMTVMGIDAPDGLRVGLICIVVGVIASIGIAALLASLPSP